MPTYTVECQKCGKVDEIYRPIAHMDDLPDCHGKKMHRIITAPAVLAEIKPYRSMITGEMIESRTQHREHLKRHNCMEIGNEIDAHLKVAGKPKSKPKTDKHKRLIADLVNSRI